MRARAARWKREAARQVLHCLAAWALVLLLAPAARAGAWLCEGRPCGATPWMCCCDAPDDRHDPSCGPTAGARAAHLQSDSHRNEAAPCEQGCHCVMVVHEDLPSLHTSAGAPRLPLKAVAVLPASASPAAPAALEERRAAPPRGPPPLSLCARPPSGRAPPLP